MIQAKCSRCGVGVKVQEAAAGKRAKCPKCGAVIQIPAAAAPPMPAIAAPPMPAGAPPALRPAAVLPPGAPLRPNMPVAREAFEDIEFDRSPPPLPVVVHRPMAAPPVAAPPVVLQHQPAPAPAPANRPCPFCGEAIALTAIKCRFCNEFLDGRPRQQPQQSPFIPQPMYAPAPQSVSVNVVQQVNFGGGKRWSRLVAMFLSLLIPGLGQLYKGQPVNGFVWFVLTVIGYLVFIIPGLVLHVCCILGAAMGDPYR